MAWTETIPQGGISEKVDNALVNYAQRFGSYLGIDDKESFVDNRGKQRTKIIKKKLTTNQLRKFFGEVKRQQMIGYKGHETDFILLKPKLAYAVGRADKDSKIKDFFQLCLKQLTE